jgi:DNA-binding transcriptional regulator YiaG
MKKLPKKLLADYKQLATAKRRQDLTRFSVPEWYLKPEQVKDIRRRLGASQGQVAKRIHISVKTQQLHEQKTGALGVYATLWKIFDKHPEIYKELQKA